jgi:hypothetical protein
VADLNVIYRIAADITGLQDGVKRAAKSAEGLEKLAGRMTSAFAGMFTVGSVISFGKAILDDADALKRMSEQTGVSLQGLQRFQIAADDAGNSVDDITSAITRMEDKLVSGDKSALKALERLGVPFEDIKNLSPENQFIAISDAIRGIHDPAAQVNIAMDLFGKQGAQILPTLKRGFDDVKDAAVGMSDETIERLDEMGDAFSKLWRGIKSGSADAFFAVTDALQFFQNPITNIAQEADRTRKAIEKMADAIPAAVKLLPAPLSVSAPDSASNKRAVDDLDAALKKQADALKKATEQQAKAREAQRAWRQSVDEATSAQNLSVFSLHRFASALPDVSSGFAEARAEAEDYVPALDDVVLSQEELQRAGRHVAAALLTVNQQLVALPSSGAGRHLAEDLNDADEAARSLRDTFESLMDFDLGQVFKDAGKFLKDGLKDIGKGFLQQMGANLLDELFGLGMKLLKGLGKQIGKLFGIDREHEEVNDLRDAFQATFGTFEDMAEAARMAGYDIKELLDTKKVEDFDREMQELVDAIAFQEDAMRTLDETVEKYGFTLEELGPALQRQNLDKKAQELYQDFNVLISAGIGLDTVLGRMGDSINEFIHDALRTGTEVPAAMRPMLERMIELGQLTDENGNLITDLEQSGITFAETMTQGFKKIVDAVEKLTDAIARGLGLAIENIPDPVVTGRVEWDVSPVPNSPEFQGDLGQIEVVPMATGGLGRVSEPTLFLAGEAGPESFWFGKDAGDMPTRSESSGPSSVDLHNNIYLDGQLVASSVVRRVQLKKGGLDRDLRTAIGLP